MPVNFRITLEAEQLDEGAPEERATFGLFTMRAGETSLAEGFDFFLKEDRPGPLVSGYPAAEWFAWSWWRHLHEPRSNVADWGAVHRMPSIGEGWLWPVITIIPDGVSMMLVSEPSSRPDAKPFRFFGSARPVVMPLSVWQDALDAWMNQICDRLRDAGLRETNLARLWADVLAERADPEIAKRRRLEAMLGRDPGSEQDDTVERLIADAHRLGADVLGEVAANLARTSENERAPLTAFEFEDVARKRGYAASPGDGARLAEDVVLPQAEDVPAWYVGAAAARALREQERLGDDPITDKRLADMAGTPSDALTEDVVGNAGLSFVLDDDAAASSRLVMRSKWPTGRRFDLARLIGDRLVGSSSVLHPATRTYTWRQKAQRAFAAEFPGPFEAVDEMLNGEYDEDSRNDVAEYFRVSPKTIEIQLMNHGRLEREFPRHDLDPALAA